MVVIALVFVEIVGWKKRLKLSGKIPGKFENNVIFPTRRCQISFDPFLSSILRKKTCPILKILDIFTS